MPSLLSLLDALPATIIGDPQVDVRGIRYDSRQVTPGDLFACLQGEKVHGNQFIPQVIAAGAAALLVEDAAVVPAGVTAVVVADIREALARISANFYGHPADQLTVIGVTGTNGKTTTVTLLHHLLNAAGHPTGLIGTIEYRIGDEILPAPHTTPQAPDLQALFARMRDKGMTHAVMEVSSHALCLHRVTGCRYRVAAFTNLTQDHLDFHGTMEAYRGAKLTLFADPQYQPLNAPMLSVINVDDPSAEFFQRAARGPVRTYGITGGEYRATEVQLGADGSTFMLLYPGGALPVRLQLVGSFNISNALAALAMALELGVAPQFAIDALAEIPPVDGRFQRVPASGGGKPTVIADYAHTPDGLEKLLSTAYEIAPGRVVVVFGCGGDRDRTKRPQMAAIADRWARTVIVTSDNPRTEEPEAIIEEILTGFTAEARQRVIIEPDRAKAVRLAIRHAAPDDLVILAGKGHEDYQIIGTTKIHFDDREEATKALAEYSG